MTNMLPRDRGEQILADHAAGMPVRAIARTYGHSPETIRNYVRGRRTPGSPPRGPMTSRRSPATARRRLADDPHLRALALLTEVTLLGFHGTRPKFYRALDRHEIRPHPCPDCHVARISGYAPLTGTRRIKPSPLPLPASPVAGETLASFLDRLAAVNRTSPETLLEALPPWFSVKARWHDDRWQHDQLTPWTDDAAAQLAAISGTTLTAIKSALPAFGANSGQPARAATACRLCAAARRIQQPVPVHLPAHHQVCLKHGIWLSGPGTPQFSVSRCPDILAAERQARRLRRRCTAEQMIYAKVQATAGPAGSEHTWKRRTTALIESNPRSTTESHPQALFLAAAYPETISAAATTLASRKTRL